MINNIVYINKYGKIVSENNFDYKVELTGSYIYCDLIKAYWYEVKNITPKLCLKHILSKQNLNLNK